MPSATTGEGAYEKKREAWALKKQGLSYTEIAKRLDIHSSEVINRLYDWGHTRPQRALRKAAGA